VALLLKLEHENLLRLHGYSINGTQVFLVYEFAVYSSLDCLLFGMHLIFQNIHLILKQAISIINLILPKLHIHYSKIGLI